MSPGLGAVSVLLGAQWGDEGKGKIIDYLIENYDVSFNSCSIHSWYFTVVLFFAGIGDVEFLYCYM